MTLREQLIGAWRLRCYAEERQHGEARRFPFGRDAGGTLIYSADGFMSALLMRADRPSFMSGDWFRPTPGELDAASAFIAYGGRFDVDEAARTVTHDIEISFFPNWIGASQVRVAEVDRNSLSLTPAAPIMSGGGLVIPHLQWRRAVAWSDEPDDKDG